LSVAYFNGFWVTELPFPAFKLREGAFSLMARASRTRRTWCATRIWLVVPTAWAFHSMLPLLFVPPASPSIQHGAKKTQRNLRTPGPLQPLGPWAALLTPVAAHAEDPQGGDWFEPFVDINAKIIEGIDGLLDPPALPSCCTPSSSRWQLSRCSNQLCGHQR
jgi:hypothetical protein